ncbi:polysaccharide biosynthesis C-terminal domain-containing protein [Haloimpatiens massiliensis]|uniref:oligosaccharide flippase family protein n=1 Tax=Haloimpatiens massiliensis TaxID=1658110 RepID=UPI000C844E94|nr:polysaccharide biosynthesis C-terminal domain-containing protein [Haloimpatiens massiliensis]
MSNKNRSKRLVVDMILYAIGDFGSKIISFLLVPFYTNYLGTDEYGAMDLINVTQSLIIPIISLQLTSGVFRYLLDDKYDKEEIVSTGINFTIVSSTISMIVFWIIYKVFNLQIPYVGAIVLLTLFSMLNSMLKQILRGLDKIKIYSITGIITTLLFCILNIIFIGYFKMSYQGMVYANIITLFIVSIFILIEGNIFKCYKMNLFSKEVFKELLVYSFPLIPNTISWWIMNVSDRYLVNIYVGMSAVGIYGLSNKFASVLFMFNSIFDRAWQTSAIENYSSPNRDKFFTEIFNKLMKFEILIVLGCTIVLKPMMIFIGHEYRYAWKYANILFLANLFLSFSLFYGVGYNCEKKTKEAFTTTVYSAILNFVINLLLIKFIGVYAAALSTLIAYFVLWISRIFTTKKFFTIKINIRELILGITLILMANLISFLFEGLKLLLIDGIMCIVAIYVYRETIKYIWDMIIEYIDKFKSRASSN